MEPLHLPLDRLKQLFECTLCGGYYRQAHTITECLHTFCRICLIQYFTSHRLPGGKAKCPKCEVVLPPDPMKTQVRYDRTLQNIVDIIFKRPASVALVDKKESKRSKKTPKISHITDNFITIELIADDEEMQQLERPFIRCSDRATVLQFKRFVALKLDVSPDNIDIRCQGEMLGSQLNMRFIKKTRWRNSRRDMCFTYMNKSLA